MMGWIVNFIHFIGGSMIDAEDNNAQQLERLFDECVDEGMSFEDAEIEAYRRYEEQGI